MALFYECMQKCAQKLLDSADIVRDQDVTTAIECTRGSRRDLRTQGTATKEVPSWPIANGELGTSVGTPSELTE